MPLDLRFASAELRAVCQRRTAAEPLLGEAAARKLRARLSDIRAASDIRQVVLGRPSFSQRGRVAFLLSNTHRLVVAAAVTPIPRLSNKQIDWAQVNILEVVEIY
jgi:hypothetical protein